MNKHLSKCPQREDELNDCMCDYIKERLPHKKKSERVTNATMIRKIALEHAQTRGLKQYRRVSSKFVAAIERIALEALRKRVSDQRRGVTLM